MKKYALFSSEEVTRYTKGVLYGSPARQVYTVGIDSRKLEEGALFVPLPGEKTDGHLFVEQALSNGAAMSLVSSKRTDREIAGYVSLAKRLGRAICVVDDPLAALQELSRQHRRACRAVHITGITGSNGKTTTKEFTGAVISKTGSCYVSSGNINSEIGLPLSICGLTREHRHAVQEVATNKPGEIRLLTGILQPDTGVITHIGTAHIGFFGSQDAIAQEKRALFEGLPPSGTGFIWEDEPYREYLSRGLNRPPVLFGPGSSPGFESARDLGLDGTEVRWKGRVFRIALPGRHNLLNALAALSVGVSFGVPDDDICEALASVRPLFGRAEIITGEFTVVRDCYNANLDSMRRALEFIWSFPWKGRRILVLGAMRELGEHTESHHRALVEEACRKNPDAVFLFGSEFEFAVDTDRDSEPSGSERSNPERSGNHGFSGVLEWDGRNPDLARTVQSFVGPGDLVLLKGSRTLELETIFHGDSRLRASRHE
jgi:UDP-N-acetylmuramoyl-tripeptide--D-alanyl-D-alanine ligase